MRTQTKTVVTGHTIKARIDEFGSSTAPVEYGFNGRVINYPVDRFVKLIDEDGTQIRLPITEYFLQELLEKSVGRESYIEMEVRIVSE